MSNDLTYNWLARVLGVESGVLRSLDQKLSELSGRDRVAEKIIEDNSRLIKQILVQKGPKNDQQLGLDQVSEFLSKELRGADQDLFDWLGRPQLENLSDDCGQLCQKALGLQNPGSGFFIKKEKALELLSVYPPDNLLKLWGYDHIDRLISEEGLEVVLSALRFVQSQEWMHEFFGRVYGQLSVDDFEERPVSLKILPEKWVKATSKFTTKKFHNVSHLKEWGIIFVIPLAIDMPGETLRLFSLLLHYLHEVPFYSRLFRKLAKGENFVSGLQSLLRGDVPDKRISDLGGSSTELTVRIVQRYLAKDDPQDWRLLEPHFNPEAEHWARVGASLSALPLDWPLFRHWSDLETTGGFFVNKTKDQFLSLNPMDLIMSLVDNVPGKYLYHQQEALWNKIFIEHFGREKINQMAEDNLLEGFINF